MNYNQLVYRAVQKQVHDQGRYITVYYRTDTACPYCGALDPFYRDNYRQNCSTCNGTGRIVTDTGKQIKCIVNKYAGNKGFTDDAQYIHDTMNKSEIKLTCLLEDVLVNYCSTMGKTYFDDADKINVDDRYYQPKGTKKLLIGDNYTMEIIADEVERQ